MQTDQEPRQQRDREANAVLRAAVDRAFATVECETRSNLARAASVRRLRSGEIVYRQGDEALLVLVLAGHLGYRRTSMDGRQLLARITGPDDLSGILAVGQRPAVSDLLAIDDAEAATWRGAEVRDLAATDAALALALMDNLIRAGEALIELADTLQHQNAQRRVARVLLEHHDLFFGDPPTLTRSHLPLLLGTSREMTGRVIRVLESAGVVARVGTGGLRLTDPQQLRRLAARD